MTDSRQQRRCRSCGGWLARDNPADTCSPCQMSGHDRLLDAPDVPPAFWEDRELQAALASRDMGRVIRAFRHHPYHGRHPLAQDDVAMWAGVSQPRLSRIETGPPLTDLDRLMAWAKLLRIPKRYLWFTLPDDDQPAGQTAAGRRCSSNTRGAGRAAPPRSQRCDDRRSARRTQPR
jgi:Helix-turn-helix